MGTWGGGGGGYVQHIQHSGDGGLYRISTHDFHHNGAICQSIVFIADIRI